MASVLSFSSPLVFSTPTPFLFRSKNPFFRTIGKVPPGKDQQSMKSSKFSSFIDLEPKSKPESLDFDIPLFDPAADRRKRFDVIVIGAGPADLRLAQQVSGHGVMVCVVDPSPLSMWPNNYGVRVDEFGQLSIRYLIVDASGFASSFI